MNATRQNIASQARRQNGAALIVSLLFLLILTLTGATAMMLSTLEERMSGNLRDRNLAFQAAESALREGEAVLKQSLDSGAPAAFNCLAATQTCPLADDVSAGNASAWVVDDQAVFQYSKTLPHVASQPLYRIEVLTNNPVAPLQQEAGKPLNYSYCYYRVTAYGTGAIKSTTAVMQSTFSNDPNLRNNGVCHG